MKSLVIAKTTKLLLLSIICFVLLSACSQNKSTSPSLQGEFNHYFKDKKYSKYVQDNLNDTSHAKESRQAKSQVLANNKAQKIALKKVKNQLSSKKKNASNQLKSAVANNGLFKPGKASSQNALKQKAPLSQVLSIVLNNNLTIKNSFEEAQASLAKYDQVSFLDDMLAQYAAFTKDLSLTGSNQKHNKSVAGGFPFPGLTSLKASIIDQAVESSRLKLKQTTQDVITQTHQTYYKLQFSKQEISLIQQEIELLNALKEEIKNSYSTNTADLNSVIQVDIEIDKDRNKLQVAKDKKRAQQAKLNALMNVSPDFVLGKLDKLKAIKITATAKQLLQKAKTSRVEIALLKSEL
ncbi:MAG: TolC family protein, partial [Cocleimonas sp.]